VTGFCRFWWYERNPKYQFQPFLKYKTVL